MSGKRIFSVLLIFGSLTAEALGWTTSQPSVIPPKPLLQIGPGVPDSCVEFIEKFEDAIADGDLNTIDQCVNTRKMAEEAMEGIDTPESNRTKFIDGVVKANSVNKELASYSKKPYSYRVFRIDMQNGRVRAIFRKLTEGLSYESWFAQMNAEGQWEFVDTYFLKQGQYASEIGRHQFLQLLKIWDPSVITRLNSEDRIHYRYADEIENLAVAVSEKQYEESNRIITILPDSVLTQKKVLLLQVRRLSELQVQKPEQFQKLSAEYHRLYPEDVGTDLWLFSSYAERNNYAACYECFDRIFARLGDPVLFTFRAIILIKENKPGAAAQAEALTKVARQCDSRIFINWDMLLYSLVLQHKYKDAVSVLRDYETIRKMSIAFFLEKTPEYADFVASDAYKQFRANQASTRPHPSTQ